MADPGFARGAGEDYGECGVRAYNGGLGRCPQRGPGETLIEDRMARTLKLKSFCPFSYKGGPKVKHLNDSWPPCLMPLLAAVISPYIFGQRGTRSAHTWIRQ